MHILFDIGGSHLRLASSEDGKALHKTTLFPTPQNFDAALELLTQEIPKLLEGQTLASIAGGVAASFNHAKTEIIHATNLPDWSGKPLAQKLSEMFQCPVSLENDCALGALGESQFGAGHSYKNFIYIAVGTGIGGAWVVHNKLVEGSYSFDIGHQVIDPAGPLCPRCQQHGHLEAYIPQPDFKKYFAIGLYNTLLHWPADAIVLGGGVVLKNNWQAAEIQNELAKLNTTHLPSIPVQLTTLGDQVGLYGALALSSN